MQVGGVPSPPPWRRHACICGRSVYEEVETRHPEHTRPESSSRQAGFLWRPSSCARDQPRPAFNGTCGRSIYRGDWATRPPTAAGFLSSSTVARTRPPSQEWEIIMRYQNRPWGNVICSLDRPTLCSARSSPWTNPQQLLSPLGISLRCLTLPVSPPRLELVAWFLLQNIPRPILAVWMRVQSLLPSGMKQDIIPSLMRPPPTHSQRMLAVPSLLPTISHVTGASDRPPPGRVRVARTPVSDVSLSDCHGSLAIILALLCPGRRCGLA